LIAEYLGLEEVRPGLPAGCVEFAKVSNNIEQLETSADNEAVSTQVFE
jgi:hypothetical protein